MYADRLVLFVFAPLLTSLGTGVIVNCQLSIVNYPFQRSRPQAEGAPTGLVVYFALKMFVNFGAFQGKIFHYFIDKQGGAVV